MLSLKREDCEFLAISTKFCNRIEQYRRLFNLNTSVVDAYRAQNELLNQLLKDAVACTAEVEHYLNVTLDNMKSCFNYIVLLCKANANYNTQIGLQLGIESALDEFYYFSLN